MRWPPPAGPDSLFATRAPQTRARRSNATDHHLFSLDISDPLAFTKAHCETELNSAEHAIDLLKSLAINAER